MAPIKVGFIGLTSNTSTRPADGARWAINAHLKYLLDNGGKYKIVALLNSSKESAKQASLDYELGDVATYGDPTEFAADPNIDLVVCSVRVDKHYPTVRPSLLAGKDAIVEWPLGKNLEEAEELLAIAQQKKAKTAVALQALFDPVVEKVKELVDSGRIGKVLSSTFVANAGAWGGPTVTETFKILTQREIGGNFLTIHFAHSIEYILYVLGEFKSWNSLIANQRPFVNVINNETEKKIISKNVPKTTPDQLLIQGTTTSGAVLSYHLRENKPFPNTDSLEWRIYGETGEIRVTSPSASLNIGSPDAKIRIAEHGAEEATEVEVRKDEWEGLALPGRNIARLYEAFAEGKRGGVGGYRDFEHAVERHKLIQGMWDEYDKQNKEGVSG